MTSPLQPTSTDQRQALASSKTMIRGEIVEIIFVNLRALGFIKAHVYRSMVFCEMVIGVEKLKNRLKLLILMEGADPLDIQLCACLDALRILVGEVEFADFMCDF